MKWVLGSVRVTKFPITFSISDNFSIHVLLNDPKIQRGLVLGKLERATRHHNVAQIQCAFATRVDDDLLARTNGQNRNVASLAERRWADVDLLDGFLLWFLNSALHRAA